MIVMKFGGTSVGGPREINNVCSIVEAQIKQKPIVVVSAVSGVTDKLLELANTSKKNSNAIAEVKQRHEEIIEKLGIEKSTTNALLKELEEVLSRAQEKVTRQKKVIRQLLDRVASFGERLSARIVAAALNNRNIKAKAIDAFDIGFVTDENYVNAEILNETYSNVKKKLVYSDFVPVITGFIAKNKKSHITTLGRGGSDYSAAIIGAALGAKQIQIWTDVNGVKSADPRIMPKAETIDRMSFAEASELAYFRAKVLHPKTIIPAVNMNIPVKVLNTNEPRDPGTTIVKTRKDIKAGRVKGIASKKNIEIITVNSTRMLDAVGFLEKLFNLFAKKNIVVDMVSTSEVSVSATVCGTTDTTALIKELGECAKVNVERNKAIVCIVGEGLNNSCGFAGKVFSCMGRNNINIDMISQGASEISISFVIDHDKANDAVRHLHNEFLENKKG